MSEHADGLLASIHGLTAKGDIMSGLTDLFREAPYQMDLIVIVRTPAPRDPGNSARRG